MPPNTMRVCRPSRWGNPWSVEKVAAHLGQAFDWSQIGTKSPLWFTWAQRSLLRDTTIAADTSVAMYRRAIDRCRAETPDSFQEWIAPLRGKNLACWCHQDSPCHADVLLEIANRPTQSEDADD